MVKTVRSVKTVRLVNSPGGYPVEVKRNEVHDVAGNQLAGNGDTLVWGRLTKPIAHVRIARSVPNPDTAALSAENCYLSEISHIRPFTVMAAEMPYQS